MSNSLPVRTESVAGSFYPKEKKALAEQIKGFFKGLPKEKKTSYVIAPHAGYIYSGKVAAHSFNALQESKCFAILSPNHTGMGERISVSAADEWQTPLGKIPVDKKAREKLLAALGIEADDIAHVQEHSIEVQIPFLQHQFKEFKILPITIMTQNMGELKQLGGTLAELKGISIVASSDFTHFEPVESAREKDLAAIEKVKKLDLEGFHKMVMERKLSICGHAPIAALMQCCREKGIRQGKLFKYDSSATASHDEMNVVGYAAIGFY
ncbi:MAG: AmmeMemoRadiSam system protein B [Candidatus Diapherotrites archaeon]|uniref:MEMO1 family protein JW744_05285 n=1 Tax=Candidatus Iainarchaeum sp. TaxID=3101447 RepID=A0A938YS00_9ARCH|nr:AmmeMemoRadiSam system protein B [Candidatus Diapherotrites archaeon]